MLEKSTLAPIDQSAKIVTRQLCVPLVILNSGPTLSARKLPQQRYHWQRKWYANGCLDSDNIIRSSDYWVLLSNVMFLLAVVAPFVYYLCPVANSAMFVVVFNDFLETVHWSNSQAKMKAAFLAQLHSLLQKHIPIAMRIKIGHFAIKFNATKEDAHPSVI